jgi:hypothetical protein
VERNKNMQKSARAVVLKIAETPLGTTFIQRLSKILIADSG